MDRQEAVRAVRRAIDEHWTQAAFAKKAKVDPGTLGDFLDGTRWPQGPTRTKIERALGWPVGTIEDIASGRPGSAHPVGLGLDDEAFLAGITPEQIESVRAVIRSMKPPT